MGRNPTTEGLTDVAHAEPDTARIEDKLANTTTETKPIVSESVKANLNLVTRFVIAAMTLITEIAVVAFIGSQVGLYYNAKTIQADCARVNLAKVGELYVQCTIVEPKKDAPTEIPR